MQLRRRPLLCKSGPGVGRPPTGIPHGSGGLAGFFGAEVSSSPARSRSQDARDAGRYVAALPEKVQQRAKWQISVEMLMSAAEGSLTLSGHLSTSSQRR